MGSSASARADAADNTLAFLLDIIQAHVKWSLRRNSHARILVLLEAQWSPDGGQACCVGSESPALSHICLASYRTTVAHLYLQTHPSICACWYLGGLALGDMAAVEAKTAHI